jgi:hypothetical protein
LKTIPRSLLRDSIAVEAYSGDGAYGPVYAGSVTVLGKVSYMRQLVRDADGEEVVSEVTAYVHPDDAAPFVPESRVTIDGRATTVIGAGPQGRPGEAVQVKVTCK